MHLKVLVIEDNEDDAALLVRYLQNCGFDPRWQRVDTEIGLAEAVEDRRWDLVLCDLSMPRLTPIRAVDCVRKVNPEIPIIIVTGDITEDVAVRLIQHGIQDIVLKDDFPRLKSVIKRELTLAENRRDKATAELRLANALDTLHQGVALFDANARLIICNQRYRQTVDRCQNDIVPGMLYSDLLRMAIDRGQFAIGKEGREAALKRLLAYQVITSEPFEQQHHDGRWIEVRRHRTDDGGIVTVATDITESKRREDALIRHAAEVAKINNDLVSEIRRREASEDALRESENRARAIFDSAADGVITFGEDRRIESVNPAAEKLFGYSAKDLIGSHVHHLMMLGTKDANTAPGRPADSIDLDNAEVRLVTAWRKDGGVFPVELTVSEVPLKDRRIYTGIIRDVTERTRLDKMKREFVSVVGHELRTPLTSIQGSLALLNSHVVGELPLRAKTMVRIGLENSERLLRLIGDILDMERIESGKMEFTFEPVPVSALVERAVEANRSFADQFGARFQIEHMRGPNVMVNGDGDRLMQVLANFISNAAKYSPPGGVITVGSEMHDGLARVFVSDQGPGIPVSFHKGLFEKFSQADGSDSRQRGGAGLGLSIAKAIMECHGGVIGYEVAEGGGAKFYFGLPVMRAQPAPEDRPAAGAPTHVLYCGEPGETWSMLQRAAASLDWNATLCRSEEDAARHLRQRRVGAIAFGPPSAEFNPAALMTINDAEAGAGEAPTAILLTTTHGETGSHGAVIRLLDWVEKPVDIERLRRRIEGGGFAELSRAPNIVCLGFDCGDDEKAGPAQPAVGMSNLGGAVTGNTGAVSLAIVDAAGLTAQDAAVLRALCGTTDPMPMIFVSETTMPQAAWERLAASLAAPSLSSEQFAGQLQKLLNAKGLKRTLEISRHQEAEPHEGAAEDHLRRG